VFKPKTKKPTPRQPKPEPPPTAHELPVFDETNEAHRRLWHSHLRRVRRYGRVAALFRDDTPQKYIY
jgi:hypothetical protein